MKKKNRIGDAIDTADIFCTSTEAVADGVEVVGDALEAVEEGEGFLETVGDLLDEDATLLAGIFAIVAVGIGIVSGIVTLVKKIKKR